MAIDDANSPTTRLLTLLNVSATKAGRRLQSYEESSEPREKLNKRRSVRVDTPTTVEDADGNNNEGVENQANEAEGSTDPSTSKMEVDEPADEGDFDYFR